MRLRRISGRYGAQIISLVPPDSRGPQRMQSYNGVGTMKLHYIGAQDVLTGNSFKRLNKDETGVKGNYNISLNPIDLSIMDLTLEWTWSGWIGHMATVTLRPVRTTAYEDIPTKFMSTGSHFAMILVRLDPVPDPVFSPVLAPALPPPMNVDPGTNGSASRKRPRDHTDSDL